MKALLLVTALALGLTLFSYGQGMPPEARQNIHALFNGHDQIERVLTQTEAGYEATTQSTNPVIAAALQAHVKQMQDRLDNGLAARRWDPAFAEYRAYYDQIDVQIESTANGVKVVATGKTPDVARVAQNHAGVINQFVSDGWAAHDALHPAVLRAAPGQQAEGNACGGAQGKGCCGGGACQGGCGRDASANAAN